MDFDGLSEKESHLINEAMGHEDSKGEKMQPFEGVGQPFIDKGQQALDGE
jgi:hypothetical protein